jgi:carboxylate-amine ligase
MSAPLTIGVEEEFFVVDSYSLHPLNDIRALLQFAHRLSGGRESYSAELRTCMVESRTGVCRTLTQLRNEICSLRAGIIHAAEQTGCLIAAAGTFPLTHWRSQGFAAESRHKFIIDRYARLARIHVICACQVHIGVANRDTAIEVMNRVRPWLALLNALSASSPFWMGEDTGYASYRSTVWERWPMAGIPPIFASYDDYRRRMRALASIDTITDTGQLYWDVRPGTNHDTVEFRPADSCTTVDDTILQAALCRALVQHHLGELDRGAPPPDPCPEQLRAAKWRAARYGLSRDLVDPVAAELLPASALIDRLLKLLRPALEDTGDWDEVIELVERTKSSKTSADRQRRVIARGGGLRDVANLLVQQTGAL